MTKSTPITDGRLLFRDAVEQIIARTKTFISPKSTCSYICVQGWWQGEMQWARNELALSSDRRDVIVHVGVDVGFAPAYAKTNQLDDISLKGVVAQAERNAEAQRLRNKDVMEVLPPALPVANATVWSDTTFNAPMEQRAQLIQHLTSASKEKGVLSAGYIELRAGEIAIWTPQSADPSKVDYYTYTQSQCSMTVRHPKGKGSGWAGLSSYDWGRINSQELAERALGKCLASLNPVAIEPGRYTTILEPQAVSQMCENLIRSLNSRAIPEKDGGGPFALEFDISLGIWRTKIGMKIMDERISIEHDPADIELGILARPGVLPVTYVHNGVLTSLAEPDRQYAVTARNLDSAEAARTAFRMSGGPTTMDEMVATTKRGLLVTRFGHVYPLDDTSLLCTGFTRDGVWLIENGKISKPVKNMRMTESPLFMLNNIEQIGNAVPVFRPVNAAEITELSPAIAPLLKVNDFSFTSMVDAI